MKIIEVVTKRQDALVGCWYGEKFRDTCVIVTNGTGGNIFENGFLRVLGEELEKAKLSFIYAHNSGAFQIIDYNPLSLNRRSGLTFELFDNCVQDLQAYIDFAKAQGYKKIILGGYSYGSNKVVYYLYKTGCKDVDRFILISPTDTEYHTSGEEKSIKEFNDYLASHHLADDDIIPMFFDDYNFYSVKSYLDYINNPHNKNLPVYSDKKNFKQLKSITIKGLFVMGGEDSFAKKQAERHLQTILDNSNPLAECEMRVVKDADTPIEAMNMNLQT